MRSKTIKLLVLLALLLVPAELLAQNTLVSGTITDAGSVVWKNGTYTFSFTPSPNNPTANYFQNGVAFSKSTTVSGSLDSTGSLTSVAVPDNLTIVPSGSTWAVQVCPAATASNGCFKTSLTITGATQSITSAVIPPAVVVSVVQPGFYAAYTDGEISGAKQGSTYFNLTDTTLHVCGLPICTWLSIVTPGSSPSFTGLTVNGAATFSNFNNICYGTGLTGINSCNALFSTSAPGLTWIPSNVASLANWSTPSNGVGIVDTRFLNDQGLLEGAFPATHSHWYIGFHAGANDVYESAAFSGPTGISVNAIADAGGTSATNSKAFPISIFAGAIRKAGSLRPIVSMNTNTTCNVLDNVSGGNVCESAEIDLNNNSTVDDTTQRTTRGLQVLSGGTNKAGVGITIGAGSVPANWDIGHLIQSFRTAGLSLLGGEVGSLAINIVPPDNTAATEIAGRNAANSLNNWFIQNGGNAQFAINAATFSFKDNSGCTASAAGFYQNCSTDTFNWENNAGNGNVPLGKDASDRLTFNSQIVNDGLHAGTELIASGTSTMASGSVSAATCATAITSTATGTATTDAIEWAYATAPTLTTDALLTIAPYVTANSVNFTRCNPTAGAIVGTAIVINWRVIR